MSYSHEGAYRFQSAHHTSFNRIICTEPPSRYKMTHISTGDLLRARKKFMPELSEYMDNGLLVPDEIIVSVVKERLSAADVASNGFILDGFPRTLAQAEALDQAGVKIDHFLYLDVADDVIIGRIGGPTQLHCTLPYRRIGGPTLLHCTLPYPTLHCVLYCCSYCHPALLLSLIHCIEGRRLDPVSGKIYHTEFNPAPNEEVPVHHCPALKSSPIPSWGCYMLQDTRG